MYLHLLTLFSVKFNYFLYFLLLITFYCILYLYFIVYFYENKLILLLLQHQSALTVVLQKAFLLYSNSFTLFERRSFELFLQFCCLLAHKERLKTLIINHHKMNGIFLSKRESCFQLISQNVDFFLLQKISFFHILHLCI